MYAKNPVMAYQDGKKAGFHEGVEAGFQAFAVLALVSAWNVSELPDAEFKTWFEAWEAESDRLFARAGYDAENLGTEILYHAGEIRKRLGMEGLE
jgi:hypothetical protein